MHRFNPVSSKIRKICALTAILIVSLLSLPCQAEPTFTGLWHIIDSDSSQPEALLSIEKTSDSLTGTILKTFPAPGEDASPRCDACEGALKGKPINGMTILWDLKIAEKSQLNGKLLDPDSGKTYACRLTQLGDGNELKLRVYSKSGLFWQDRSLKRAN